MDFQDGWIFKISIVTYVSVWRMDFQDIQRDLCIRPVATPKSILKSSSLQDKGASSLQNQFGSLAHLGSSCQQGSSYSQSFCIKQEPKFSVQSKKLSDRINRVQSKSNRS